ncbi:MAG: guanylate kinase, partial [Candidatus Sumerlaeota bacterium]|nr:guanylate kinase [Candidatus Sumerlaeota bacterium]
MTIHLEHQAMLIVLSSPSGGGKSSICRALLVSGPNLEYSISMTSRPPRGDEANGRAYHFVTVEEFERRIEQGHFYEWALVHDNYYGTPRDYADEKLARGKDVVLDLDVVGGLNLKKATNRAVLVFILPPSFEVLEDRLRGRKTDSEAEIQKRLRNARMELDFAPQ